MDCVSTSQRRNRNGVVLLTVCLLLVLVLALLGLGLDAGRLVLFRSALQARVEAAALRAVLELDGTPAGVGRARLSASETVKGQVDLEFSRDPARPWVRVTAVAPVPLLLAATVVRHKTSQVSASAAAEQKPQTAFEEGLFPYSPVAPDSHAPHFGFQPGEPYTLLPAAHAGATCSGDEPAGFVERLDAAVIRQAILYGYQTAPRNIGDPLESGAGNRQLEMAALIERIRQDTDPASPSYSQYSLRGLGNGRRIVAAPVRSPLPDSRIVQIGAFFLLPPSELGFCAEYLGPYLQGSRWKGAAQSGYHLAVLVR